MGLNINGAPVRWSESPDLTTLDIVGFVTLKNATLVGRNIRTVRR